ncbi:MAG: GtrA family protein [Casimicrobiaceae bacterium]
MIRVAKYFGVGAVASTVDISLFALFAGLLRYNYLIVGCFTFVLATAVGYVLTVRYVFESGVRFERRHEILLVFAVSAVGLALNQLVLYLSVEFAQANVVVGKLIATGAVFGWNYLARARFVFRDAR